MFQKKKRHTRTPIIKNQIPKESSICTECGGTGETMNENHYIADFYPEHRYVLCPKCLGKGYVFTDRK